MEILYCIAWVFIFREHISQTYRACFYQICDLRRIRKSLGKQIAVALVISKLDYCNSLLHSMQKRISLDFNAFTTAFSTVVTKAPRFSRSVSILKRLHWLPVKFRINFKISTITFQTLKTTNLHIWLIHLFGRNAQNIYTPQIEIVCCSPYNKTRLGQELSLYLAQPYETPCLYT